MSLSGEAEVTNPTWIPDCFACTEAFFNIQLEIAQGILHNGEEPVLPPINPATTYAPCWVAKDIGGAIAWACITLPTCHTHLKKEEPTAVERATRSGLALPGPGGRVN